MRLPLIALVGAFLVAAGMLYFSALGEPGPARRPVRCWVDVLDAHGQPVHKLCSNGRGYERTSGHWRDAGPLTPMPGTRMR